MMKTIFIMPNKETDSDATLMIVVDEVDPSTDPKTYQYVYVGNINDLPSDVLTEGSIINDLTTGGTDKPLSAEQGRTLNSHVNYTTCGSGASDEVKLISDDGFELSTHLRLLVMMANTNTHATPKFNINNTGVKDVWYNGAVASDTNTWSVGEVLDVYYDGSKYVANTHGDAQFATGEKVGDTSIINDLTTGGEYNVLSAEQGKALKIYLGDGVIKSDSLISNINYGLINLDGTITTSTSSGNYRYTNFIPVTPGDSLEIITGGGGNNLLVIAGYSSNSASSFVSSSFNQIGYNTTQLTTYYRTVPEGVNYILVCGHKNYVGSDGSSIKVYRLMQTDTFISDNFANKEVLDRLSDSNGKLQYSGSLVFDENIVDEKINVALNGDSINIRGNLTYGYVQASDGAVMTSSSSSNYRRSGYIEVNEEDNLTIKTVSSNSAYLYACYDVNKAFVSAAPKELGSASPTGHPIITSNITIPSGVKYVVITAQITYYSSDSDIVVEKNIQGYLPNKTTLDKFSENEEQLLWNGEPIQGGDISVSSLIVDLPVSSDGTGIDEGYAYIESSTYYIKVKHTAQ